MGGPVDDDMANLIVAQLLYLDSVDQQKDITMYVNSPGGSVTAGATGFFCRRGCVRARPCPCDRVGVCKCGQEASSVKVVVSASPVVVLQCSVLIACHM